MITNRIKQTYLELLRKIPMNYLDYPGFLAKELGDWLDWIDLEYTPPIGDKPLQYHFKPNPAVTLPTHAHWVKCPKCKMSLNKIVKDMNFIENHQIRAFFHHLVKFGYCLNCHRDLESRLANVQINYAEHQLQQFVKLLKENNELIQGRLECNHCMNHSLDMVEPLDNVDIKQLFSDKNNNVIVDWCDDCGSDMELYFSLTKETRATYNPLPVKFKIIVPVYNCSKWLEKCLQSVEEQSYKNYDILFIDDNSNEKDKEKTKKLLKKYCKKYDNWNYIFREKRMGALYNIVEGIKELKCRDEDIVLQFDGDDWLFSKAVLSRIAKVYTDKNILMTIGNCITWPQGQLYLSDLKLDKARSMESVGRFNDKKLFTPAPRSFKYFLWKNIKEDDLKDDKGNYHKVSWDKLYTIPLLEMINPQKNVKFMSEALLVYNRERVDNDDKLESKAKLKIDAMSKIKQVAPYKKLKDQRIR